MSKLLIYCFSILTWETQYSASIGEDSLYLGGVMLSFPSDQTIVPDEDTCIEARGLKRTIAKAQMLLQGRLSLIWRNTSMLRLLVTITLLKLKLSKRCLYGRDLTMRPAC